MIYNSELMLNIKDNTFIEFPIQNVNLKKTFLKI
jgi:hypothetical protein